jgi:hypothetical protein
MNKSNGKWISDAGYYSSPFRLSRLALALAACSLLGAGVARGAIINDSPAHEPPNPNNNTLATATLSSSLSDEFQGCVGPGCNITAASEDVDFVGFSPLVFGATYKLTVARIDVPADGAFTGQLTVFDLYRNLVLSDTHTLSNGSFDFAGLTGVTDLRVGIHRPGGLVDGCCEGYSVKLALTAGPSSSVPEPASAALIAAGLLGAFAARRRKRS